jgi:hypothetical protein
MSLTWETIDEQAFYPEPRYAAIDGPDRYEIHYNRKERRWVLFQNGEAWRSQTPDYQRDLRDAPRNYGPPNRPAQGGYPRGLDEAKAMAEEMVELVHRRDQS